MSPVVQVFCWRTTQVSSHTCLTFVDERGLSCSPYLNVKVHGFLPSCEDIKIANRDAISARQRTVQNYHYRHSPDSDHQG